MSVIKKWMNLSGGFNCRPDTKEETGIRKQDDRSTECILTKANKNNAKSKQSVREMSDTGKRSNVPVAQSQRGEDKWDNAIPEETRRLLH